jgi:hypothetical protein
MSVRLASVLLAVTSAQVAALQGTVKDKDGEIGKMREQMLARTTELRAIIGAKDSLGNDVQAITDRALKCVPCV